MYSQNNEEAVILEALESTPGFFLDFGAADGVTFSNTYALAKRGWSGVCVEPSPRLATLCRENHRNHPRVLCVEAAILPDSLPEGSTKFYDLAEYVNSVDPSHAQKWAAALGPAHAPQQLSVTGVHVGTLIRMLNLPALPSLLSIDCESLSVPILFDFMRLNILPSVICVEHDGRADEVLSVPEIRTYYVEKARNPENLILALSV